MPPPKLYIIGRDTELAFFDAFLAGGSGSFLLNVYGPGGIGKSWLRRAFEDSASRNGVPCACLDAEDTPGLTFDRLLYGIAVGFPHAPKRAFRDFARLHKEYLVVNDVLKRAGGLDDLFGIVGDIKDPPGVVKLLSGAAKAVWDGMQARVGNRIGMNQYLGQSNRILAEAACKGIEAVAQATGSAVVMIDTYERIEELNRDILRYFVVSLPPEVRLVVLGRNSLTQIDREWREYGQQVNQHELGKLSVEVTNRYLIDHNLSDVELRAHVVSFTGGYPLLLDLAVESAENLGGWEAVGSFGDGEAATERVASRLLDRILREEKMESLRRFLEVGPLLDWFNPRLIQMLLEVPTAEANQLFQELQRHSFVGPHRFGLCFQDDIQRLLRARLKFAEPEEYESLKTKIDDFLKREGG